MKINEKEVLWVEKYRPQDIEDAILPDSLKDTLNGFVKTGVIPNLVLYGSPGLGKSSAARALVNAVGGDVYIINGSLDMSKDALRNDIKTFASSMSFKGGRKYVLIEEGDNMRPDLQLALRAYIEEFSSNASFIITANYERKIMVPMHSRFSFIDFTIRKENYAQLATDFAKRCEFILSTENIPYNKKVLFKLIGKFFPDMRRVINELQKCSVTGQIDENALKDYAEIKYEEVIGYMKAKKFTELRTWVAINASSSSSVYDEFYENAAQYFKPSTIPYVVLLLAKYQYQSAFVVNQEINLAAFLVELMETDGIEYV